MLGWEVRIVGARLKQRRGQQDVYMKCNNGVIRKKQHFGQHDVCLYEVQPRSNKKETTLWTA